MITGTAPVSAFVVCKNEVAMIGSCIESLAPCREIVIVDSNSTDGTVELIESYREKGYPIRLFQRDWPGYAAQKQFALDQCVETWCLNLDADERLDETLQKELPAMAAAPQNIAAWELEFRMFLYGYGYTPDRVRFGRGVRLVRKDRARYRLDQLVHEGFDLQGEIAKAHKGRIMHARSIDLAEQILKENQYSSLKARQLFEAGRKPRPLRLLFNPFLYFHRMYFSRKFYLCGWPGFIHAGTSAIYSFLTEAKLYQMHAKERGSPSET
jgi:glycosyltransferase involved in cell wall biosynthesis